MTISAVIVCHANKNELIDFIERLKLQSKPPDEVICLVCCMDLIGIEANILVSDVHREDWGASKCDIGLQLATKDYVWYCNTDDEPNLRLLERFSEESGDIIACDFNSRLAGSNVAVAPVIGQITRGTFTVRRELALKIGYIDRSYEADGLHAKEIAENGTFVRVAEVLYDHR